MMASYSAQRKSLQSGFSHVESLIAIVLLVLCLAPAVQSLTTGTVAAGAAASAAADELYLRGKLEEVLAQTFVSLDAAATAAGSPTIPTSYSDASDATRRRLVYLSRYDGNNSDGDNNPFTGTDARLLWVSVEIAGTVQRLMTLTSDY
jgi:hypothetical protein